MGKARGNRIVAMIPARIGSTRLKMKNLALLKGKPVISYAIDAAKNSGIFQQIVINSDNNIFKTIADRQNIDFYRRPKDLGSSITKSDDVVFDFMKKHQTDVVAWINPISPLQTGEEIRNVIEYFIENELDSLITVKDEQVHCVYKDKPVNFSLEGKFAQTQDLAPVQSMVYSVMMWRTETFMDTMNAKGEAILSGKVGYYPVNKFSSIIIKTEEDLKMAEYVLTAKDQRDYKLQYDDLIDKVIK